MKFVVFDCKSISRKPIYVFHGYFIYHWGGGDSSRTFNTLNECFDYIKVSIGETITEYYSKIDELKDVIAEIEVEKDELQHEQDILAVHKLDNASNDGQNTILISACGTDLKDFQSMFSCDWFEVSCKRCLKNKQ